MRFRSLSLAIALLAAPFAAAGAAVPGPLYRRRCRRTICREITVDRCPARSARNWSPRGGFVGLGSVGYALGNGLPLRAGGQLSSGRHLRHQRHGCPRSSGTVADLWRRWPTRCSTWISACRGCIPISAAASAMPGPICIAPRRSSPAPVPADQRSRRADTRAPSHSRRSPACRSRSRACRACRSPPSIVSSAIPGSEKFAGTQLVDARRRRARYHQAAAPVQQQLPARCALCLQRGRAGAGRAGRAGRACARAGALLSGVLRLGQGDADRSRAADRQGGGRQLDPRAVHADRGERLHRHLRHPPVQPGSVAASRAGGAGRTGQGRRAAGRHHHPGLRRHASAGADRPWRARAAEPSGRDHHPEAWTGSLEPRRHTDLRLPHAQRAEHHGKRGKSRGHADGELGAQLDSRPRRRG